MADGLVEEQTIHVVPCERAALAAERITLIAAGTTRGESNALEVAQAALGELEHLGSAGRCLPVRLYLRPAEPRRIWSIQGDHRSVWKRKSTFETVRAQKLRGPAARVCIGLEGPKRGLPPFLATARSDVEPRRPRASRMRTSEVVRGEHHGGEAAASPQCLGLTYDLHQWRVWIQAVGDRAKGIRGAKR